MEKVGLLVRMEAKLGKEAEVESIIKKAVGIVEEEQDTIAFAFRISPTTFGIFDAFLDAESREKHLANGNAAAFLMNNIPDLLAQPLVLEKVDVFASKLPQKKVMFAESR